MRIKHKRTNDHLLWYCADDFALYMLYPVDTHFDLIAVEGETFLPSSTFSFDYQPNLIANPLVDGDTIFLPTVDGRLLGLDKYSHENIVDVDLGPMMAIGDIACDQTSIYTVCAIPISNRPKTDTDVSVICVNDRKTGLKTSQSCVLPGDTSNIILSSLMSNIWISYNKTIARFGLNGEQEKTATLSFRPSCPIYLSNEAVFALSAHGSVEVFDFDLQPKRRSLLGHNKCTPARHDDVLYWPIKGQMIRIDLDTERIERLSSLPCLATGCALYYRDHIYAATEEGNLMDFDVNTKTTNFLSLGSNLRKPLLIGDNLFIASESEMFQICLNTQ